SSITVEIEELIEAYLGCFFRIDHIEMMRSRPAEISGKSYEWHRDFDPMAKIHILIYLTVSGPLIRTTFFANVADTRRCVEQGYAFPPRSRRVADINSLFPDDADPIVPTRPTLAAGDATIFTPSRILHRGIIHDTEYRDLLVLNILPSMNPWENEIAHLGTERLFIGRSTLWFDPFTRFKPSMAGHNRVQVPLWAQLGYHFPLVPAEE
ncbi:MAG: hypothetical protein OXR84_02520, partial [Magnetovibrio sp.]|nr:hypothetical protein [Magnetovibrio sp.]